MTEHEREYLINTIKAMSQEEQAVVVTMIDTDLLWDELRKRETDERNFQNTMTKIVWEKMG